MNPQNGMTTLAAVNGQRASQSNAGRPKFVEWALRLVLCSTDTRTDSGDLQRLIKRAEEDLALEERSACYETANAMLAQLRAGVGVVAEQRRVTQAAEAELAEKMQGLPRSGALRGEWK